MEVLLNVCATKIDRNISYSLVNAYFIEKVGLSYVKHSSSYTLEEVRAKKRFLELYALKKYKNEIRCSIIPLFIWHDLLVKS